jgi:enoyl-CoA hydratase/carnithine racemase
VLRGMDAAPDTGLALETKAIELLFCSRDRKEGMAAFIKKRKSKFNGKYSGTDPLELRRRG